MEVTSSPILVFQAGAQSTQAERFSPNVWILFPGRGLIGLLRSIVVIVTPEPFVARNISGLWRLLKSRIVRACATSKPVLGRNPQTLPTRPTRSTALRLIYVFRCFRGPIFVRQKPQSKCTHCSICAGRYPVLSIFPTVQWVMRR